MPKEMSGRKFMVVILTSTYCIGIIGSLSCVLLKLIPFSVFLGIFSGLGTMVVLINEWYFNREDRQTPEPKQEVVK